MKKLFAFVLCLSFAADIAYADVIDREGKGFLELVEGQRILHVAGTPYECGFQHGRMLKEQVQRNVAAFVDNAKLEGNPRVELFKKSSSQIANFIPANLMEEMKGLAEGSAVPLEKIVTLNLFPEMFHCTGMTAAHEATKDGSLYHVRVLDYILGSNLQESAVLIIAKPDGAYGYLNVSYAGFIGSVTGMNDQKIAIGEIGGYGYGYWEGVPMAFLMREILEKASDLNGAKAILSQAARTCEYFYVISDGKNSDSLGVYATSSQIHFIRPGDSYALLAPSNLPANYEKQGENDKFFLSPCSLQQSSSQMVLLDKLKRIAVLYHEQPQNVILLTGFTHPERYPVLADRVQSAYGKIDEKVLEGIVQRPVAMETNLHNAIFQPAELKVWIAHAGPNGEPACTQPYVYFNLAELLTH